MNEVRLVINRLKEKEQELGRLSDSLAEVQRKIEPVEREVTEFYEDFILSMYDRAEDEDDFRLPRKDICETLAKRALRKVQPDLYGRHLGLSEARQRLQKRISDLRVQIEAERSLLSAEKTIAEAT